MVSTTTASCPEAAATLAAMNGTIARSGSSRPWVQWNSSLATLASSVAGRIYGRLASGSRRRGGAVARTRMVVVGGDAAGMSAASQARRRRGPGELEIVAFDLEAGRVRVRDLDADRVTEEPWDLLVVATGSEPLRPPIDGIDLPGVYGLSVLQDGIDLRKAIDAGPERAVIVGGGYIGLEAAEALVNRGVATALVEAGPQVMNRVDPDMGELVSQAVRDIGVELYLDERVEAIEGAGRVRAVRTAARTLEADLVVLGLGTRPAVALASSAGITIGPSGAIAVNPRMRTPHDGVWAAGDCVEARHLVSGEPVNYHLGTIANKQGRICGINIGGGYATFPGVLGTAVSKVCEVEVARTGLSEAELGPLGLQWEQAVVESATRAGYFPE